MHVCKCVCVVVVVRMRMRMRMRLCVCVCVCVCDQCPKMRVDAPIENYWNSATHCLTKTTQGKFLATSFRVT